MGGQKPGTARFRVLLLCPRRQQIWHPYPVTRPQLRPTLGGVCEHQLGAKGAQQDAALKRHRGGHGQHQPAGQGKAGQQVAAQCRRCVGLIARIDARAWLAGWLAGWTRAAILPLRHGTAHTAHAPVAACGGDEGESDAGIARGWLHKGRLQATHREITLDQWLVNCLGRRAGGLAGRLAGAPCRERWLPSALRHQSCCSRCGP